MMNRNTKRSAPSGFALVTALIFLVLLTLVGLAAVRNSGLEATMSGNNTMHTQAFEASELSRTLLGTLIDAHTFNRGWPGVAGGTVANDQFDSVTLALLAGSGCNNGFCLTTDVSTGKARDWYNGNSENAVFSPTQLDNDTQYRRAVGSGNSAVNVVGEGSVYKLYTSLAAGAGAAQVSGYLGLGRGAAAGGGNIYYYLNSTGHESSTKESASQTAAIYRDVIRN